MPAARRSYAEEIVARGRVANRALPIRRLLPARAARLPGPARACLGHVAGGRGCCCVDHLALARGTGWGAARSCGRRAGIGSMLAGYALCLYFSPRQHSLFLFLFAFFFFAYTSYTSCIALVLSLGWLASCIWNTPSIHRSSRWLGGGPCHIGAALGLVEVRAWHLLLLPIYTH